MYNNHVTLSEALDFFKDFLPLEATYDEKTGWIELRTKSTVVPEGEGLPAILSQENIRGILAALDSRVAGGKSLPVGHQALHAFCQNILPRFPSPPYVRPAAYYATRSTP